MPSISNNIHYHQSLSYITNAYITQYSYLTVHVVIIADLVMNLWDTVLQHYAIVCVSTHARPHACMYVHTHARTHAHTHTYTHIHTHTSTPPPYRLIKVLLILSLPIRSYFKNINMTKNILPPCRSSSPLHYVLFSSVCVAVVECSLWGILWVIYSHQEYGK